jgi:hypothetical protein
VSFLLTVFGYVFLALSLAGVVFGVFMAMNSKARETGKYFALWWIPGAAAASGIVMRDIVTFTIGSVCFVIAGAVFAFEARSSGASRREGIKKKRASRASEETTAENEKRNFRRRAS